MGGSPWGIPLGAPPGGIPQGGPLGERHPKPLCEADLPLLLTVKLRHGGSTKGEDQKPIFSRRIQVFCKSSLLRLFVLSSKPWSEDTL